MLTVLTCVLQGCIPPLCDLLSVMDPKVVIVALNGLENILRLGESEAKPVTGINPYSVLVEECYGLYEYNFHTVHLDYY